MAFRVAQSDAALAKDTNERGFPAAAGFAATNMHLSTFALIAMLEAAGIVFLAVMLMARQDKLIPVRVDRDGMVEKLNVSMDDYISDAKTIIAKGFTRRVFMQLLKRDYRYYENSIASILEDLSPRLRNSIVTAIKRRNVYKDLAKDETTCDVTIILDSIKAVPKKDGYEVTFQALVDTGSSIDIPRRVRQTLVARLISVRPTTPYWSGFQLDTFSIQETVPEKYEEPKPEVVSEGEQQLLEQSPNVATAPATKSDVEEQ
jgi:hypothetical protein